MDICIREIREDDRKTYLKLANDFYNSSACLHPIEIKKLENSFDYILKSKVYADLYMLEVNNRIIGYCMVSKTYSQEAGSMVLWAEELYIIEEYRSKGIATKVFNYLFKKYKDYSRIRLEVTKENEGAMKLYKRLGFDVFEYVQMIVERP